MTTVCLVFFISQLMFSSDVIHSFYNILLWKCIKYGNYRFDSLIYFFKGAGGGGGGSLLKV